MLCVFWFYCVRERTATAELRGFSSPIKLLWMLCIWWVEHCTALQPTAGPCRPLMTRYCLQICSWLMFSLADLSSDYQVWLYPRLMPHLFPLMNILLTAGLTNLLCLSLCLHQTHTIDRAPVFALARYILPSAVFSSVSNIPKFLLIKAVKDKGWDDCEPVSLQYSKSLRVWLIVPTQLRLSTDHVYVIISNTVTTGLLPLIAWIILISRDIKKLSLISSSPQVTTIF